MRTSKLKSTLIMVACVHSSVNRNWASPKIIPLGASEPPWKCFTLYEFWPNRPLNLTSKKCFGELELLTFTEKLFAHVQGPWNMIWRTCGLACGWAYGCTIPLVAAIVIVRAKHHWNPFVLDTAETTPTATSFCAISIHVFLPGLCPRRSGVWSHLYLITIFCFTVCVCVCKSECGHVWQPGCLYSPLGRLVLPSCTKHISATDSSHRPEHDHLEEHLLTSLVLSASLRCSGISLQWEMLMQNLWNLSPWWWSIMKFWQPFDGTIIWPAFEKKNA